MVKIYFYNIRVEVLEASHLKNETFFKLEDVDVNADFLFISLTNQSSFFKRLNEDDTIKFKKIVLYNLTEPISFSAAKEFCISCMKLGVDSKNVLFHSTNHFLDQFNCLHKGLSITDHSIKSQLYTGYVDFSERFLKFSFLNNTLRTPRAMVINEMLNRDINYNQSYVSCNGDYWYGDRNILRFENISKNLNWFQSHDCEDVYRFTSYDSDRNFQSVYKNSLFNFTIETFSDFAMDNSGFNSHLTEKTIRNFAHKIPFLLLISSEHQIKIIEELGFKVFNNLFDFKIDLSDINKTVNSYTDIIERISNMKSADVKKMVLSDKFQEILEHNYTQYSYYKNLNIENIYRYILSNEYENKNEKLLEMSEPNDFIVFSIIGSNI